MTTDQQEAASTGRKALRETPPTQQGQPRGGFGAVDAKDVNLLRVVRAEWLKFWTLRSSIWIVALTLFLMVGFSTLMASGQLWIVEESGGSATVPPEILSGIALETITLSYGIGQIVVAVLGVMVATSEYATGQIRSTLAAVPTRLPVLFAKIIVVTVVSFVLGAVAVALSWLATWPILNIADISLDLSVDGVWRSLLGVPLYFTAIALLGLGIGFLIRHTAGGISVLLGILLVLPILAFIPFDWMQTIAAYLPNAGERLITSQYADDRLTPWQGFGVLCVYVVAALGAAGTLLRARDA